MPVRWAIVCASVRHRMSDELPRDSVRSMPQQAFRVVPDRTVLQGTVTHCVNAAALDDTAAHFTCTSTMLRGQVL